MRKCAEKVEKYKHTQNKNVKIGPVLVSILISTNRIRNVHALIGFGQSVSVCVDFKSNYCINESKCMHTCRFSALKRDKLSGNKMMRPPALARISRNCSTVMSWNLIKIRIDTNKSSENLQIQDVLRAPDLPGKNTVSGCGPCVQRFGFQIDRWRSATCSESNKKWKHLFEIT